MKKKEKNKFDYKKAFFVSITVVVVLGCCFIGSFIVGLNKKSEKYENLLPYLMQMRIIEACKTKMDATGKAYNCRFDEYGVSPKGDVYAKYNIYEVDKETGEKISDTETRSLYFKQDEASKNDKNGSWGVSEYQ